MYGTILKSVERLSYIYKYTELKQHLQFNFMCCLDNTLLKVLTSAAGKLNPVRKM
jgi:hypothetical protein